MKKIALILIITLSALNIHARKWLELNPDKITYSPKSCALIKNPGAACNKGKEPFSSFIKRFTASKTFRNTRIKVTPLSYSSSEKELKQNLENIEPVAFPIGRKKGELGTFYNVSADMVCYRFEEFPDEIDPESECGGFSLSYCFQRIGGLWFLTDIAEFG